MAKSVLVIVNHPPYDGTDVAWNALRLIGRLKDTGREVRVFLMNDAVDLARESPRPPEGYFDLVKMTKALVADGVSVSACVTCIERAGMYKGEQPYEGIDTADLDDLIGLMDASDQVLAF